MNYYFYWQASYQQINQLKCLLLRTIKFKPYRLCLRLEMEGWGQRKEASWLVTTQSDQIKRQVLIILFFILKQLKRKDLSVTNLISENKLPTNAPVVMRAKWRLEHSVETSASPFPNSSWYQVTFLSVYEGTNWEAIESVVQPFCTPGYTSLNLGTETPVFLWGFNYRGWLISTFLQWNSCLRCLETELAGFYEHLMIEVGLIYLKAPPLSGLKIEWWALGYNLFLLGKNFCSGTVVCASGYTSLCLETELACFYEHLMIEVGLIYLKAPPCLD